MDEQTTECPERNPLIADQIPMDESNDFASKDKFVQYLELAPRNPLDNQQADKTNMESLQSISKPQTIEGGPEPILMDLELENLDSASKCCLETPQKTESQVQMVNLEGEQIGIDTVSLKSSQTSKPVSRRPNVSFASTLANYFEYAVSLTPNNQQSELPNEEDMERITNQKSEDIGEEERNLFEAKEEEELDEKLSRKIRSSLEVARSKGRQGKIRTGVKTETSMEVDGRDVSKVHENNVPRSGHSDKSSHKNRCDELEPAKERDMPTNNTEVKKSNELGERKDGVKLDQVPQESDFQLTFKDPSELLDVGFEDKDEEDPDSDDESSGEDRGDDSSEEDSLSKVSQLSEDPSASTLGGTFGNQSEVECSELSGAKSATVQDFVKEDNALDLVQLYPEVKLLINWMIQQVMADVSEKENKSKSKENMNICRSSEVAANQEQERNVHQEMITGQTDNINAAKEIRHSVTDSISVIPIDEERNMQEKDGTEGMTVEELPKDSESPYSPGQPVRERFSLGEKAGNEQHSGVRKENASTREINRAQSSSKMENEPLEVSKLTSSHLEKKSPEEQKIYVKMDIQNSLNFCEKLRGESVEIAGETPKVLSNNSAELMIKNSNENTSLNKDGTMKSSCGSQTNQPVEKENKDRKGKELEKIEMTSSQDDMFDNMESDSEDQGDRLVIDETSNAGLSNENQNASSFHSQTKAEKTNTSLQSHISQNEAPSRTASDVKELIFDQRSGNDLNIDSEKSLQDGSDFLPENMNGKGPSGEEVSGGRSKVQGDFELSACLLDVPESTVNAEACLPQNLELGDNDLFTGGPMFNQIEDSRSHEVTQRSQEVIAGGSTSRSQEALSVEVSDQVMHRQHRSQEVTRGSRSQEVIQRSNEVTRGSRSQEIMQRPNEVTRGSRSQEVIQRSDEVTRASRSQEVKERSDEVTEGPRSQEVIESDIDDLLERISQKLDLTLEPLLRSPTASAFTTLLSIDTKTAYTNPPQNGLDLDPLRSDFVKASLVLSQSQSSLLSLPGLPPIPLGPPGDLWVPDNDQGAGGDGRKDTERKCEPTNSQIQYPREEGDRVQDCDENNKTYNDCSQTYHQGDVVMTGNEEECGKDLEENISHLERGGGDGENKHGFKECSPQKVPLKRPSISDDDMVVPSKISRPATTNEEKMGPFLDKGVRHGKELRTESDKNPPSQKDNECLQSPDNVFKETGGEKVDRIFEERYVQVCSEEAGLVPEGRGQEQKGAWSHPDGRGQNEKGADPKSTEPMRETNIDHFLGGNVMKLHGENKSTAQQNAQFQMSKVGIREDQDFPEGAWPLSGGRGHDNQGAGPPPSEAGLCDQAVPDNTSDSERRTDGPQRRLVGNDGLSLYDDGQGKESKIIRGHVLLIKRINCNALIFCIAFTDQYFCSSFFSSISSRSRIFFSTMPSYQYLHHRT